MKGIIASEGAGNRVLPVISPALSYVLRVSQNFSVNADLSLKTSALRWLTAEVSLKYDMVRNVSNVSNSRHRLQTTGSLVILPVPKLMIEGNVYHSCWYTPDMDVSDSPVIKAAVSWEFGKFTVFAECRNILGVNELRREVTMPNRTVTYVNRLLGRQILAGIRM